MFSCFTQRTFLGAILLLCVANASASERCVTDLKIIGVGNSKAINLPAGYEKVAQIQTTAVMSPDNADGVWSADYAHILIRKDDVADTAYSNCLTDIRFGNSGKKQRENLGWKDSFQYYQDEGTGAIATQSEVTVGQGKGYVKAALWTDTGGAMSFDEWRNFNKTTKHHCNYCTSIPLQDSDVSHDNERTFLQIYTSPAHLLWHQSDLDLIVTDLRVRLTNSGECTWADDKLLGYELMGCMDVAGNDFNESYWPSGTKPMDAKKNYMAKFYKMRIHTKPGSSNVGSRVSGSWHPFGVIGEMETETTTSWSSSVSVALSDSFSETVTVGSDAGFYEAEASATEEVSTSVKESSSSSTQTSIECEINSNGPLATAVYFFWKSSFSDPQGNTIFKDAPACAWVACSESPSIQPDLRISDPQYFTKLKNQCNVTEGMAQTKNS